MGIAFIVGMMFGGVVAAVCIYICAGHGTLHIEHSSEKDFYRFEIDRVDNLDKKTHFIMKVKHHNDLPQK